MIWRRVSVAVILLSGVLLSAHFASPTQAQQTKIVASDVIAHLKSDKFIEIETVKDFPAALREHILKKAHTSDIGKVFADSSRGLENAQMMPPPRQLLFGGKSDSLCFLYYQTSGVALVFTAQLYKLRADGVDEVWNESFFKEHPTNMQELLQTIKSRLTK